MHGSCIYLNLVFVYGFALTKQDLVIFHHSINVLHFSYNEYLKVYESRAKFIST